MKNDDFFENMQVPDVTTTLEFAKLVGLPRKTIQNWHAAGRFKGCCRKRGKHLLFLTKRALEMLFKGPDWNNDDT